MTAQCGDKNSKELQTEQDALQTLRKKKKTEQDAPNTRQCKTTSTCKCTHINYNSKLLTQGALEIAPQQAQFSNVNPGKNALI